MPLVVTALLSQHRLCPPQHVRHGPVVGPQDLLVGDPAQVPGRGIGVAAMAGDQRQ